MLSKFRRSWALAKLCLGVLARNKKLLVFPIVSFCFWVLMIILFFAPVAFIHTGYTFFDAHHWQAIAERFTSHSTAVSRAHETVTTAEAWAFWVLIYVGAMFAATFANVAFYHEILRALRGEPVSIHSGINFALGRLPTILFWSLFAGIIGLIIRTIEERVGLIGRLVMALIGTAWSVACLFVIPVLVESDTANPVTALKRSANILVKTWGETIIGFAGLNFGSAIMMFATILVIAGCVVCGVAFQIVWLPVSVGLGWLFLLFAYAYVMGVASHIYRGALYLYAAEGQIPAGFSVPLLNDCWKHKKSKV